MILILMISHGKNTNPINIPILYEPEALATDKLGTRPNDTDSNN